MLLIPSIDIRAGRSVRLYQGSFSAETVYGDPVAQAVAFVAGGARLLHVVDLDAARTGDAVNDAIVEAIVANVAIDVEVGGGIRSAERAEALFASGVDRVVLGTAAVENPALVSALSARYPSRVLVGLDYRTAATSGRREVALRGWEAESGLELLEALALFDGLALAGIVATDIGRDSTLAGADLEGYRILLSHCEHPVIASGGVGSVADLAALAALEESGRALFGTVVGKALVSGAISLEEALAACAP